ncbi:MAG: hypothetical protein HY343_03825 [Lentisphaerae bacterium]|nr:hypothetical protein [Lentisphaerota bacterium]
MNDGYAEAITTVCNTLKPASILEFGSGVSTTIFARFGPVQSIEYDPPGDWHGVRNHPNVTLHLIPPERDRLFPQNLLKAFFTTVVGEKLGPGEDPLSQANLKKNRPVKWDLAYIDGAVHVEGFSMSQNRPGWVGGDLSYVTRMALAGLCLTLCRHVIIDDMTFLPMLKSLNVYTIGERFYLLSR